MISLIHIHSGVISIHKTTVHTFIHMIGVAVPRVTQLFILYSFPKVLIAVKINVIVNYKNIICQ